MAAFLAHLRTLAAGLVTGGVLAVGGAVVGMALFWPHRAPSHLPDPPALLERVREVARLQSLDVAVYKKVTLEPDPKPASTLFGELAIWASYAVAPPAGTAIVFADVHLGLDLTKIDAATLRISGESIEMVLPPVSSSVEVRPGETEIVRSNLDSASTSQLLDKAKWAIQSDIDHDAALRAKARASAEHALRALFAAAGFKEVRFVDGPLTVTVN